MVARQVRRSVVMSNLRVGLLPMDSDRTPLGKWKNVLHGGARAAPLRQSVEQPWSWRQKRPKCGWWALATIHLENQIAVQGLVSTVRTRKDAGMGGQGFRPPLEASKDSAPSALSIRALPFFVRDQPAPPRGPGATSAKPSATKLDAILLTSSPVRPFFRSCAGNCSPI